MHGAFNIPQPPRINPRMRITMANTIGIAARIFFRRRTFFLAHIKRLPNPRCAFRRGFEDAALMSMSPYIEAIGQVDLADDPASYQ
jgi:hypothetical protein